jgi:hypothetical protein
VCALQNGDHIKLNAALGKRLKTAVSDFGHLAGLPFLLILIVTGIAEAAAVTTAAAQLPLDIDTLERRGDAF